MTRTKESLLSKITEGQVLTSKKVDNNTLKIQYADGKTAIRLHDTDVVTELPNGNFILNSGGWRTSTTKDRINKYAPVSLYQDKGIWYIGNAIFKDGIVVDSTGNVLKGAGKDDTARIDKVKKQIAKFCSLITKDNLPVPSNGDCWHCLMHDKDGVAMGDFSHDTSHLISHMKEKYVVGSLLVNAMRERGYKDESIGLHYSMKLADTFRRAVRRYMIKRLLPEIAAK